jgi:hypothetical protein
MRRTHTALVSLMLGVATVAGVLALERTVALGPSAPDAASSISMRRARLDRVASEIEALRRAAPPAAKAVRTPQSPREQVIYVRAAPLVRAHGSEHESEHELEDAGEHDD